MKKSFKKCGLIVKVLIGLAALAGTSCSNLFDDFLNEDGSIKNGDTRLSVTSNSGTQINSENFVNTNTGSKQLFQILSLRNSFLRMKIMSSKIR